MDLQQHLRAKVLAIDAEIGRLKEEIQRLLVDLREYIMVEGGPMPGAVSAEPEEPPADILAQPAPRIRRVAVAPAASPEDQ